MITPETKDHILSDLVALGMSCSTDVSEDCTDYNIDCETYSGILDQFERRGLIRQDKYLGGAISIHISIDAHDFVRNGGFLVQEELLKANIEKLGLEIDLLCKELTPNQLDMAHKISAIGSSILTALNFIK